MDRINGLRSRRADPSGAVREVDGAFLGTLSYHFGHLRKLGLIELAEPIPRRGALEHVYRLTDSTNSAPAGAGGPEQAVVFAPRPYLKYPRPAADAAPDDPAILDRTRGDIVLDRALFREMRRQGHWPLLLNITTREVANLVTPTGRVAHRLHLTPPASADRVLHLLPSPLHDCRLCQDGIETPKINAHVLAERHRTREERTTTSPPCPQLVAVHPDQAAAPNLRSHRSSLAPSRNTSTLTRVDRALAHGESTMTFQELMDRVGPSSDIQHRLLREHVYNFRIQRAIDFDGPLQPSTVIHRRTQPTE